MPALCQATGKMMWPLSEIVPSKNVQEDKIEASRHRYCRRMSVIGNIHFAQMLRLKELSAKQAARAIFCLLAPHDETILPDAAPDSRKEVEPFPRCRLPGEREGVHY